MSADTLWLSHDLFPDRDVKIGNEVYRHRRCHHCKRNFVMVQCGVEWIAVYVSSFRFIALDRETHRR